MADLDKCSNSKYKDFWADCPEDEMPLVSRVKPTQGDCHVVAEAIINGLCAGLAVPKRVDKWWGYELHFKNDEMYCMKMLVLEYGGHTSMHFHVGKHETLLVTSGVLTLETIYNKNRFFKRLGPGTAVVVAPGYTHRLIAAEGQVTLIEASTQDFEDDSIRIE